MSVGAVTSGVYAWWGPALAFLAGLVSFASPCVFPLVPGYLAFISGGQEKDQRSLAPIALFIAGFSAVFIALGAFSSRVIFDLFKSSLALRIAGVIIIAFGVFMILYARRLGSPAMYAEKRPLMGRVKPGPAGAFPLGMAFAAGWTPCIGPVYGAILTMAATGGTARAVLLLAMYSLGLGLPFLLVGLGVRRLMGSLGWVQKRYHVIVGVSGVLMVAIGFLMASGLWLRYLTPLLNRLSSIKTPI